MRTVRIILTLISLIPACQGDYPCTNTKLFINLNQDGVSPQMVERTVRFWNDGLGREVLSTTRVGGNINVHVYDFVELNGVRVNGYANPHSKFGIIKSCDIYIRHMGEEKLEETFKHEVGHCLGIEDEYGEREYLQTSVMLNGHEVLDHHRDRVDYCLASN